MCLTRFFQTRRCAATPEDATHGSRQNGVISVNSTVIRPFFENVSSLT
jgi:hypothetical protein